MSIRHRTVPLVLLCQAALAPALAAQGVPPDIIRADSAPPKRARPTVHLSGYLQVFYKARRDANGDGITEPSVFRDQRVRIGINGKVTDHVGYDIEIDPRAPEVAGILRDAFITLDYLPHHEVRIGQQKTLFGYENPTSSSRLYTVNRSEVSDNLSRGVNLRDIGLGLAFKLTQLDLEGDAGPPRARIARAAAEIMAQVEALA